MVIESGFFVPAVESVTVARGVFGRRDFTVFGHRSALHRAAVAGVESDGVTPHSRVGGFDVHGERSCLSLIFDDDGEVLLFLRRAEIQYAQILSHVGGKNHIFFAVRTGDVEFDPGDVEIFADEVFGLVFTVIGDGYTDDFDRHAGSKRYYRGQYQKNEQNRYNFFLSHHIPLERVTRRRIFIYNNYSKARRNCNRFPDFLPLIYYYISGARAVCALNA